MTEKDKKQMNLEFSILKLFLFNKSNTSIANYSLYIGKFEKYESNESGAIYWQFDQTKKYLYVFFRGSLFNK